MKKQSIPKQFETLLFWKDNIQSMIKRQKNSFVWKFLKRCPSCYSNNLDFVEGRQFFEKWFCLDCTAMHFAYFCPGCKQKNWIFHSWKKHIYKEYKVGKYRGRKNFYSDRSNHIKDNISLHKKALIHWKEELKEFNKYKDYKVKYSGRKK